MLSWRCFILPPFPNISLFRYFNKGLHTKQNEWIYTLKYVYIHPYVVVYLKWLERLIFRNGGNSLYWIIDNHATSHACTGCMQPHMYTSQRTNSIRSNSCTYVHSMEHTTHVHNTYMHTRSTVECTWITHACAHTRLHGGVRHLRRRPVRRATAKLARNGAYASLAAPICRRCSTTSWGQRWLQLRP